MNGEIDQQMLATARRIVYLLEPKPSDTAERRVPRFSEPPLSERKEVNASVTDGIKSVVNWLEDQKVSLSDVHVVVWVRNYDAPKKIDCGCQREPSRFISAGVWEWPRTIEYAALKISLAVKGQRVEVLP